MSASLNNDPCFLPVSVLAKHFGSGRLSPVDVMDAFLARIAKYDEKLHAYSDVYRDEARLAAEAADKAIRSGHPVGAFHGVPIALKDLIELNGRITTGGSAHFRNRRSQATATLARRLIANGVIILGKTHTVEFAYSGWGTNQHMGAPWNPWDNLTARTPGGSSSGSGVAVAAGLAPWAVGTDTGGSVRLPASFCGLTGLKPTIGRISTAGIIPLSQTLDTPGPLARSVLDVALLYNLMRGSDPLDQSAGIVPAKDPLPMLRRGVLGLRLGRMPLCEREGATADVLEAYDRSLQVLTQLGAEIVDVELPFRFEDCFPVHMTIVNSEAYANFHEVVDDETTLLDESVRIGIRRGRDISARQYLSARTQQGELQRAMAHALRDLDALLTPTTETAAIPITGVDKDKPPSRFTRFANTLGLCALALPNGATSAGLPLSLQIVCKGYDEALALRVGYAFQEATEWHLRVPELRSAER
ncbi:amidase [Mesorhizobium sp. M7A.F.Ca.US.006.01.1.1]|uniref:amidase n=1 Tax=Mesorhizobium sp. M7A.F.Ca.US.006.01.1.1 TaxID=2496707 RepID=UPI000FCB7CB7|nr:amidase [Mesorhizobium sp. M7A.F.Ca.US.006.01.1.1]RUZ75213.1 amidase [Mesorhizobium sp. M7A.F.Ca.US.006.01.1.1]